MNSTTLIWFISLLIVPICQVMVLIFKFFEHIYNSCFEVCGKFNFWVHLDTDSIDWLFPCFSTKYALGVTLYLHISAVSQ